MLFVTQCWSELAIHVFCDGEAIHTTFLGFSDKNVVTFMPLVMVEFPLKVSREMCELSNITIFRKVMKIFNFLIPRAPYGLPALLTRAICVLIL